MTARTLVITGANGFVGIHVAALAAADGVRVWGLGREPEPSSGLAPHCEGYVSVDLHEEWRAPDGVDAVVHLAGLAAVGPSFDQPQRYIDVNSGIMTRMCEALLSERATARVVVVSTGAVYAPPNGDERLDETFKTIPTSPYAVAKLLVEAQASYYARRGLDTVIARPFNHIGPGQGLGFLVPDLADAISAVAPGEPVRAGDLSAARDFTDVRDVARAYLDLAFAQGHRHHVYNVASGRAYTGFQILEAVAHALGRPTPEVVVDPSRLRANDTPRITGSARRLVDEFGWRPQIDITQSITDFVAARG